MTRIDHTGHNHPATPAGRDWCRKLRLADRPEMADYTRICTYNVQAFDAAGNHLDMDGTPQGESFCTESTSLVMWMVRNARWGVRHGWDNDTHTLAKIRTIKIYQGPNAIAEVYVIEADGTARLESWNDGRNGA